MLISLKYNIETHGLPCKALSNQHYIYTSFKLKYPNAKLMQIKALILIRNWYNIRFSSMNQGSQLSTSFSFFLDYVCPFPCITTEFYTGTQTQCCDYADRQGYLRQKLVKDMQQAIWMVPFNIMRQMVVHEKGTHNITTTQIVLVQAEAEERLCLFLYVLVVFSSFY